MKTNLRIMASIPTFLTACLLVVESLLNLWIIHRVHTFGEFHGITDAHTLPRATAIGAVLSLLFFWAAFISHRNRAALWVCALVGSALILLTIAGFIGLCLQFNPNPVGVAVNLLFLCLPMSAGLCGVYGSFLLLFVKQDARHA